MNFIEKILIFLSTYKLSFLHLYFYSILIILNFSIIFFNKKISAKFNLYDEPNERKLHLKSTSYLGGVFFLFSHLFYLLFYQNYYFESHSLVLNMSNIFSMILISTLIFFTGLIDDKVDLDPLKKSIIILILISSSILIDEQVLIKNLNFEIIEKTFNLKKFSLFFTIICIYIFINACNMFDGADLQIGLYFFIILIYLYLKSNYLNIFMPILIPLVFFIFLNLKNFFFIGNSGSHFLGYLISLFIVKFYNLNILESVEEVIILMLIPGLDLIRLFFLRSFQKKPFFKSDLNHIHHVLLKHNSKNKVQMIVFFLNLSPILVGEIFGSYFFGIIYGTLIYFFFIFRKID
jgi:UDP-GlcNAc:undecaprenyl-phosphate/decaprenyl-phosphate GlcNAc-1-phosphate transferase